MGFNTITKNNIRVLIFESEEKGIEKAKEILYEKVDEKTALFLSGGSTPKPLYEQLAKEKRLKAGVIAQVDERYGEPFHKISNQLSIRNSGLLNYFEEQQIKFFPILEKEKTRIELAKNYEHIVEDLFNRFQNKITILGIGEDGHTASIAPNRTDFNNPLFGKKFEQKLVGDFKDPKPMSENGSPVPPNGFGERITLTINALSQMDLLVVLVFGEKKKKALELVLSDGPVEKAPMRFCLNPKVSSKTLFITDQKV